MAYLVNPSPAYCEALGRFVVEYADLEFCMSQVLRIACGVTKNVSGAIFTGTRCSLSMAHIKRIQEGKGEPLDPWLERAFPKIAELTTARDSILHNGNRTNGDLAEVTTKDRSIKIKQYTYTVSAQDIDLMIDDTETAKACLIAYWVIQRFPRNRRYDDWKNTAQREWVYKPPVRVNNQVNKQR